MVYTTQGTCSRQITFDVVDNKLTNVRFLGGCSGNTQGVSKLVEGMDIDEVIKRTDGILCGARPHLLSRSARQGIKAVQSPAEFLNQESFAASDNKDLEMSKAWSPISPGFFQFIFQRGIVIPA